MFLHVRVLWSGLSSPFSGKPQPVCVQHYSQSRFQEGSTALDRVQTEKVAPMSSHGLEKVLERERRRHSPKGMVQYLEESLTVNNLITMVLRKFSN
jgi:hypothetical protein